MPFSAASMSPFLFALGAGECALHVAEQLRFEERLGQCAAIERHERPIAAQRIEVDGAGNPFLAGARFAGDEHRAVGARDLLDQLEDGEHLVAAPDDIRKLVGAAESALQQHVLLAEQALLERVAHLHLQLVDVERLAEVIVRAEAHRLDRGVRRGKCRDHDAEDVRVDALCGPKHVNTRHVGHLDVRDQQIEPPRSRYSSAARPFSARVTS